MKKVKQEGTSSTSKIAEDSEGFWSAREQRSKKERNRRKAFWGTGNTENQDFDLGVQENKGFDFRGTRIRYLTPTLWKGLIVFILDMAKVWNAGKGTLKTTQGMNQKKRE